eukprot:4214910-Prymnesium_polylepis.2
MLQPPAARDVCDGQLRSERRAWQWCCGPPLTSSLTRPWCWPRASVYLLPCAVVILVITACYHMTCALAYLGTDCVTCLIHELFVRFVSDLCASSLWGKGVSCPLSVSFAALL